MIVMDKAIQIVSLTALNVRPAYKVAKAIFPHDGPEIRRSFIASLLPTFLLPVVTNGFTGLRLTSLDYFIGVDCAGTVVGVTGLYGVKGKNEIWIGWYGVTPCARGQGYGRGLLDWTIETAKQRG